MRQRGLVLTAGTGCVQVDDQPRRMLDTGGHVHAVGSGHSSEVEVRGLDGTSRRPRRHSRCKTRDGADQDRKNSPEKRSPEMTHLFRWVGITSKLATNPG